MLEIQKENPIKRNNPTKKRKLPISSLILLSFIYHYLIDSDVINKYPLCVQFYFVDKSKKKLSNGALD